MGAITPGVDDYLPGGMFSPDRVKLVIPGEQQPAHQWSGDVQAGALTAGDFLRLCEQSLKLGAVQVSAGGFSATFEPRKEEWPVPRAPAAPKEDREPAPARPPAPQTEAEIRHARYGRIMGGG